MRTAIFSAKPYDRLFLDAANNGALHELLYLETHLSVETAPLAQGARAICAFVNDDLGAAVLEKLFEIGVRLIVLRSAGFNHVDLTVASRLGMTVARVPAYSPHAVAEHAVALLLSLNRKTHRAHARVREANFSLQGLIGFDLQGKTVGVVGVGKIGSIFAKVMHGFGCTILAYDKVKDPACVEAGVNYVSLQELFIASDIVSLHCPLNEDTRHMIDERALSAIKRGAVLINTGRGALVDTPALIKSLKSGHLGGVGLDVYEEEEELFFEDLSTQIIQDDVFMRLLTFPNVLVTAHQAFFTEEAMTNIAETSIENMTAFETGRGVLHEVRLPS